jgi:hypothetical protein
LHLLPTFLKFFLDLTRTIFTAQREVFSLQEKWLPIADFEHYAVSNLGRICNLKRDALLTIHPNNQGIAKVGLQYSSGRLTSRSVAVLVAEAFLRRERETFNSPINRDGDRMNCQVDNLLWRPRWFAVKFHRQFLSDTFRHPTRSFMEIDTREIFTDYITPCVSYGLYYVDVILSYMNNQKVFPTRQQFKIIEE